jgi:predicted transcriptional regulator
VREGLAAAHRGDLLRHEEAKRRIRTHASGRKRTRREAA